MPLDEEQRLSLNRSKLRKILAEDSLQEFGNLTDSSGSGIHNNSTLWVIADEESPESLLGASLLELTTQDQLELVIFFEDLEGAQVTQRRASILNQPLLLAGITCKMHLLSFMICVRNLGCNQFMSVEYGKVRF